MGTALALVRSEETDFAINALIENAITSNPDQLFTYEELSNMTGGLTREQIYQLTRRVNRIIIPKKRMYINVRKNGYKIATAPEQLTHSDKRRVRSMRQTRWAIYQLNNIDVKNLSKEEKDKHTLLTAVLHNSLDCVRKRTISGLKNTQKAVMHQEAALNHIEIMKKQLDEFSKRLSV